MRFTNLKTYNTISKPQSLAQPSANPQVHPHCQGDLLAHNDHQVPKELAFSADLQFNTSTGF